MERDKRLSNFSDFLVLVYAFVEQQLKRFTRLFSGARCVFKSSSPHVILLTTSCLIWGKPGCALSISIIPCVVVAESGESVCFCGCARCFYGLHTVDIRLPHLDATGCSAHVSPSIRTWSRDFNYQQAHSYIFDHVHWLLTSGSFLCLSSLILYYL